MLQISWKGRLRLCKRVLAAMQKRCLAQVLMTPYPPPQRAEDTCEEPLRRGSDDAHSTHVSGHDNLPCATLLEGETGREHRWPRLPDGWAYGISQKHGNIYYINTGTGLTCWEPPTSSSQDLAARSDPDSGPPQQVPVREAQTALRAKSRAPSSVSTAATDLKLQALQDATRAFPLAAQASRQHVITLTTDADRDEKRFGEAAWLEHMEAFRQLEGNLLPRER